MNDFNVQCPACGTEHPFYECWIGTLGNLEHFSCRSCGMGWSERTDDPEDDDGQS